MLGRKNSVPFQEKRGKTEANAPLELCLKMQKRPTGYGNPIERSQKWHLN